MRTSEAPTGPGCCSAFLLAIPGFLLLEAIGVDETDAFWISLTVIFVVGSLMVPYLYWRGRRAGVSTSAPPRSDVSSTVSFRRDR